MTVDRLRENEGVVDVLYQAIRYGGSCLADVPALLKKVLRQHAWEERYVHSIREVVKFARFTDFVETGPPEGLGADVDLIRRIVRDDAQALDDLDQVTVGRQGAHRNNVTVKGEPDRGNARQYALRKLRRDRPDLHAKVIAGDLSANAAMLEAGFRKKPSPLDDLKRAWRKATDGQRAGFLSGLNADRTSQTLCAALSPAEWDDLSLQMHELGDVTWKYAMNMQRWHELDGQPKGRSAGPSKRTKDEASRVFEIAKEDSFDRLAKVKDYLDRLRAAAGLDSSHDSDCSLEDSTSDAPVPTP